MEVVSAVRGDPNAISDDPFRNPDNVDEAARELTAAYFDLVAVGRALLNDPQWPNKLREGRRSEIISYADESLKSLVI